MHTQHKPELRRSKIHWFTVWLLLASFFLAAGWTRAGTGVQAWMQRYGHAGDSLDVAMKVVADSAGNVIVAGYTDEGITGLDMLVIKYSGAGVPLWTNRYSGPGSGNAHASAVAVDGSGNVFVTGSSEGAYATIAYSGAGVPLWTNRYNVPGNSGARPTAVAVDGSGNVVVTGSSFHDGSYSDYATIKYSGAGVPLWTNRYNGPGNYYDSASALAVDGSGNVFVTGSLESGYVTIAYSGAGVPLWTNRYRVPGNSGAGATAVAVDGSGNVFVTGYSHVGSGYYDYSTIKYSGAGVPLWTNRYNGPANGYGSPGGKQSLALSPDGSAYVTGSLSAGSGGGDFATIKYISVPVLAIGPDGSGGFFISVAGVPNVTYRLQRAPTVSGGWSDVATNAAPASGLIEYHETNPLPGHAFYRAVTP